jgi:F-type H+-transporting ATPase subunit gamma
MESFRPYAGKFAEVLGSLAEKAGEEASPLLVPRENPKKIHIVLCTSDRGLCGGFNINLTDKAKNLHQEKPIEGMEFSFTCFGKKGRNWVQKAAMRFGGVSGRGGHHFGFSIASMQGRDLVDGFLGGDYDEVFVIYSQFIGWPNRFPW